MELQDATPHIIVAKAGGGGGIQFLISSWFKSLLACFQHTYGFSSSPFNLGEFPEYRHENFPLKQSSKSLSEYWDINDSATYMARHIFVHLWLVTQYQFCMKEDPVK